MKPAHDSTTAVARRGFALLSVLFVLIALLVLCAPFLMTARNASRSSTQLSERVQTRLALDAAITHSRANLGFSHPATDSTPYFDDEEELKVVSALRPSFWNNHDPREVMWDVDAHDVAGRIDVGSAPPQVFANLIGAVTRLSEAHKPDAKALSVLSTAGFLPEGFLWVGPELVHYGAIEDGKFTGLLRGIAPRVDEKGNWTQCGPSPAVDHDLNVRVIDQRAFAIPLWRISEASRGLRSFDAIEQVREAGPMALAGELGADLLSELQATASVHGGVRGGPIWQRAVRVTNSMKANEDCVVRVAERRWFNPGTTVVLNNGRTIEFALVVEVFGTDSIRLAEPVRIDYMGYRATIAPLARRPVNVNVAPAAVLEALFVNLQLNGSSNRITRDEARKLAALCIESRPFVGLEDFLRRIVLPSAGVEALPKDAPVKPTVLANQTGTLIDVDDALALYANALNANDSRLHFSTMPLSFVSRDVYSIHARAAVNAPSGTLRSSGVREEVTLIVPQQELIGLWSRQEDYEEAVRLSVDAPFWATGPNSTSRFDPAGTPPSRLFAHWGTWKDQPYVPGRTQVAPDEVPSPEHVFASREDAGWTQLMPSRVEESILAQGRMLHFDNETRDLEGRYLPDEPITYLPQDKKVQWTPANGGLARGISASFWIKPRDLADSVLLDFGAGAMDTDRIVLAIEGPDLVLRVIDGPGDHPDSVLKEHGEVRFEVAPGVGPGLSQDTWSFVELDVRGNRPDQIHLAIDGRRFGVRTMGQTRLTSSFAPDTRVFTVESGEGFPDRGVARIGNELVEYVKQSPTIFVAQHELTGPHAGFGGRLARTNFGLASSAGVEPGASLSKGNVNENHATGTPVQLYGSNLALESNVPSGEGFLAEDIGRFAVGIVTAVEVDGAPHPGEAIDLAGLLNPNIGTGMEGLTSRVTGLVLAPADPAPMTTEKVMRAFQKSGGYAMVMQLGYNVDGLPAGQEVLTQNGSPVWGAEIVHYTNWDGDTLFIDRRGALPTLNNDSRPHAFVLTWSVMSNEGDPNTLLHRKIFVVPISINAGASAAFLPPINGNSEFAQITELGAAELTEWVRYDRIEGTHLVRSDPLALERCRLLTLGNARGRLNPLPGGGGGGGGPLQMLPPVPPPAPPLATQANTSQWSPYLGQDEDVDAPVTRTARTALQFRGVLGTYSHDHARNTRVLPVWRVAHQGVEWGEPGHGDFAFLIDASPNDPGWPIQVHRAFRPREHMQWTWVPGSDPMTPVSAGAIATPTPETGFNTNSTYVAANAAVRGLVAAGTSQTNISAIETRLYSRFSAFPSGERPRNVNRVEIGRALDGSGLASAVIDEFTFGHPRFGEGTQHADAAQGAQLLLLTDLAPGAPGFRTYSQVIRVADGLVPDVRVFLNDLPQDAGLLRIGSEILCYDSIDVSTGLLTIASGGRGLLGTTEETHEAGESITFLEPLVVTTLAGSVSAGGSALPLEDPTDFPREGTVLVDGELLHYTHLAGSVLEMPRASSRPGAMDENGDGLFRGRFGTTPSSHAAGTPVILFPFRYWDRWADRADAPELAYYGLSIDQPNAYWRGVFFQTDEPEGTKIEVLQRSNPEVPWDAEPETAPRNDLALIEDGLRQGAPLTINRQRDALEWRVYVRYAPRAFDFDVGLSHGWKRTPRLVQFGVEYLGPHLTLRRVDE